MKKILFIPILAFIISSCGVEDLTLPVDESLVTKQENIEQSDSYDLLVKGSPYKIVSLTFNGNDISDINVKKSRFVIDTNLDIYDIKVYRGNSRNPLPNINNATIKNIGITDDTSGTLFSDDTPQELDYKLSNFGSSLEITFTTGVNSEFAFKMFCNRVF